MTTAAAPSPARVARFPVGVRLARWIIALLTPVLLCLGAVRVVMSPLFLQVEYTRPGFPADFYGLTTEDRLRYAPFALDYLIYDQPLTALADLRFPDGTAMYNQNELLHMRDVQVVTRAAFLFGVSGAIAAALLLFWLYRDFPDALPGTLRTGAIVTGAIIVSIVVASIAAWDRFFTLFHELFFADGTWVFPYSDTLIRLFPEQFWFDAAITIGALTLIGAAILFGLSVIAQRRLR
jgi:integral membrane protein (TIGR01906 family)